MSLSMSLSTSLSTSLSMSMAMSMAMSTSGVKYTRLVTRPRPANTLLVTLLHDRQPSAGLGGRRTGRARTGKVMVLDSSIRTTASAP